MDASRTELPAVADYGGYRQGFGPEFFAQLRPFGVGLPRQKVLDIGTGTGLFAREWARRGCQVTALDAAVPSLSIAAAANAGDVIGVRYAAARAEALPVADGAVDLVSAGSCWHLFERPAAAREALRVLRPGGRLLIAQLDLHPLPGGVGAATLEVLRATAGTRAAARADTFFYPEMTADLLAAGFRAWNCFGFTTHLAFTKEGWRARMRSRLRGVLPETTLARFDRALWALLGDMSPPGSFDVEHRVFALLARATA